MKKNVTDNDKPEPVSGHTESPRPLLPGPLPATEIHQELKIIDQRGVNREEGEGSWSLTSSFYSEEAKSREAGQGHRASSWTSLPMARFTN